MPLLRYRVYLEVSQLGILYHWNYDPPVRNIWGGLGEVLPGGSMHGVPYDSLHALGNGWHTLEFDEAILDKVGYRANPPNRGDRTFEKLRFWLLAEKVGVCMAGEPFASILLAFSEENADRIIPLLTDKHTDQLRTYAKGIAESRPKRARQKHGLITSVGFIRIPDKNLAAIRRRFGENTTPHGSLPK